MPTSFYTANELERLLLEKTGIKMNPTMKQRLDNRLKREGSFSGKDNVDDYLVGLLSQSRINDELKELYSIVTINETYFFRDPTHFVILRDTLIPEILEKKKSTRDRQIKIWCAACSSGEEPYSVAMILAKHLPPGYSFRIYATDISTRVLNLARAGEFNRISLRNDFHKDYSKYYTMKDDKLIVNPEIRKMVNFMYVNLKDSLYLSGIDIVFLRNVLIYFDQDTKHQVIDKMERCILPEGYVFLGVGEGSTMTGNQKFKFRSQSGGVFWQKTKPVIN